MDNFEDIKQLWESENTLELPNLVQIQSVIKKFQTKKKRNFYLLTGLFIMCFILLVVVMIFQKSLLWTTTFGEILIVAGFISGIILKLKTLKKITKNELKSNKDFLEDLIKSSVHKKTKANRHRLISVLMLAIGYGFFIYEEIRDSLTKMILIYSLIVVFTLVMFFIFKPFLNGKSERRTKRMLKEIEELE